MENGTALPRNLKRELPWTQQILFWGSTQELKAGTLTDPQAPRHQLRDPDGPKVEARRRPPVNTYPGVLRALGSSPASKGGKIRRLLERGRAVRAARSVKRASRQGQVQPDPADVGRLDSETERDTAGTRQRPGRWWLTGTVRWGSQKDSWRRTQPWSHNSMNVLNAINPCS